MEKHALPNQRLRRERQQRGWSQEDVARKIGAPDDKTVRRRESGKVTPSPHYRQMLCTLYGKSAEELGLLPENSRPIWNIPYRRNPFFTGREALLSYLRDELSKHAPTALTQPQAISGLGGIGKTQIAVEYAYRYREQYRYVLWMRATSREVLLSEFVTLARLLQLPEQYEQDPHLVVSAVRRWLITSQQWLLILDNADDLAVVEALLPHTGTGHILLTTRAHATGPFVTGIAVETMDLEEGTLLLLRRAKLLASEATLEQASQQDRARTEAIVEMLGGLPPCSVCIVWSRPFSRKT